MTRFNEMLMKRMGGWYIILVFAMGQALGLLGAIPGLVSIQLTVELSEEVAQIFARLIPLLFTLSQIILLGIGWWVTQNARSRLTDWSKGTIRANEKVELAAWKEITNITTRYGIIAFLVFFIINVIPLFLITLSLREVVSSVFQPGSIASPVPAYIFLGGLSASMGAFVLTILFLERFALPVRLLLIPSDFEAQLKGRTGALLGIKFQTLILGLIIIGVAIIAPIGYQQTVRILYSEVSSFQIFSDLQTQTLFLSALALVLGIVFSYLATRSISDPLEELIEVLQKIEQGDLKKRVPVTATDEFATVAIHFNRMISQLDVLQSTLEQQVAERTKQLTATNEVGRVASSILDPDELLSRTANLITEQFNYYYASIYLLDPSEKWAELKEATGQAGKVLKQNRHRLEISGKSMVAGTKHCRGKAAIRKSAFALHPI